MLKQKSWMGGVAVLGAILFLYAASFLPRAVTGVFASPDETAVYAFAHGWTLQHGFQLSTGLPDGLAAIGGLHPRSMVQQGNVLVPVGFLGMPIIVGVFERLWQGSAVWMLLVLFVSSAVALWQLVKKYGAVAAWTSALVYLSFPTVLLYANRTFFPNLPVVALTLWSVWSIQRAATEKTHPAIWSSVAGLCVGLIAIIRPIELLWVAPWLLWALLPLWISKQAEKRSRMIPGVLVASVAILLGYAASVATYQTWLPTIGYWLRDVTSAAMPSTGGATTSPLSPTALPFGIHPRALWQNIHLYLFGILGPWLAVAFVGVACYLKRHRLGRAELFFGAVVAWTVGVLFLCYGQSLYADNIRIQATLGNSFLRYVLPLVPLIAFGIGLCIQELWSLNLRGRFLAVGLVCFFIVYGIAVAFFRDEEGLLKTRHELTRYAVIRETASRLLPPGTILLSERSDKIFVGLPMVAVSPMPSDDVLRTLWATNTDLGLFHRTLTPEQTEAFAGGMFTASLEGQFSLDNETLYRIYPASP